MAARSFSSSIPEMAAARAIRSSSVRTGALSATATSLDASSLRQNTPLQKVTTGMASVLSSDQELP